MRSRNLFSFFVVILILIFLVIQFTKSNQTKVALSPSPHLQSESTAGATLGVATKTSNCVSVNDLPDKDCTPGATDPKVTQDNINQTICVSGYTKTVRPPESYTNKLKLEQIADYDYTDTNLKDYEEDHLISLELGGSPSDPANLWPEYGASPNPKDKIENLCHQKVCNGQILLKDAQLQIATNWHTACQ